MKARRVKGLDPRGQLADQAERIVRVRLDEVHSFAPRALDPSHAGAQHDMRIAAKRLRYVLEVTGSCFGPYAVTATKRARELQDLLGEIHDCDVMLPCVHERLAELQAQDSAELRRLAGDAADLDPGLVARAPNRASYHGLLVLAAHLQARRDLLFERFLELWSSLAQNGFRGRLEAAVAERPAASQDGGAGVERAAAVGDAVADRAGELRERLAEGARAVRARTRTSGR